MAAPCVQGITAMSHCPACTTATSQSGGGGVKGGQLDGAADPSGRPPITSVTGQVPLREIAVDPIILQLVPISPSLNWALMCKIFGPFGRHEG